jgi:mycofactocin precursor
MTDNSAQAVLDVAAPQDEAPADDEEVVLEELLVEEVSIDGMCGVY